MKKFVAVMVALFLLLSVSFPALAVTFGAPVAPVIEDIDPVFTARNSVTTLSIKATVSDGGTMTYQWYETHDGTLPSIMGIIGQEASTFTCDTSTSGTRYYVCMVTNTIGSELTREYSSVIAVTVYEPVPMVTYNSTNIELDELESYNLTAEIQLKSKDIGTLTYKWYQNSTNYIGTGSQIAGATSKNLLLTGTGTAATVYYYCIVRNDFLGVVYEMNVEDMYIVKVKNTGIAHVHAFSEWMATTEPTCTEPGINTRECLCGVTEREEIPALGHDFGAWTVDPTDPLKEIRTCENAGCGVIESRAMALPPIAGTKLSISAPEPGQPITAAWTLLTANNKCTIDEARSYWEVKSEQPDGGWNLPDDRDNFDGGRIYRAVVILRAETGYIFDSSTEITVNGNALKTEIIGTDQLRVVFEFPMTAKDEVAETEKDSPTGSISIWVWVVIGIVVAGALAGGTVLTLKVMKKNKPGGEEESP